MYSMTGYGRGLAEAVNYIITTEIKTVNHRFLDINLQAPQQIQSIEEEIHKILKQYFHRGRIQVSIHVTNLAESSYDLKVDWPLLDQYMEKLNMIKDKYKLQSEIPIDMLSKLPDLFLVQQREDFIDQVKSLILSSVTDAALQTKASRKKEGLYLQKDLISRIQVIHHSMELLQDQQEEVALNYQERIKERVESFTRDLVEIDYNSLYQEIALLIEKGDITEEIIRTKSHIDHCLQLFKEDNGGEAIGRRADFIVQEIHRELNTIGSKAIDDETGKLIVNLKGELEKVREQIQNIE